MAISLVSVKVPESLLSAGYPSQPSTFVPCIHNLRMQERNYAISQRNATAYCEPAMNINNEREQ